VPLGIVKFEAVSAMALEYGLLKFLHILIAIVALGTSAGLSILLEFFGHNATHGAFVLRAIERIVWFFVFPGYVLVLVTGLWMVFLVWPWTARWIQAALAIWGLGAVVLGGFLAALHKQIALADSDKCTSAAYAQLSLLSRLLGGGFGLVVVVILYLMVHKPEA
jgi:hypothetical protein